MPVPNDFRLRPVDEDFIELLLTRTKCHLKTLHCVSANGLFYCLDLSLKAPTKKELDAMIIKMLEETSCDTVLPAASRAEWLQLPHKMDFLKRYVLRLTGPPYWLGVILLTGQFQENW